MRKSWTRSRLLRVARQIEAHHAKVEAFVQAIREQSLHPLADVIADELDVCIVLESAVQIVEDALYGESAS